MKVGNSLMLGLKGESLSPEERKFLISSEVFGVILFKRNIKSFQQLYELCRELKSLSLFIGVDLEGGSVNRFSHLKEALPWPSAQALGGKSASEIFSVAKALGETLRALSIDINFAPVVDVPLKESSLLKSRTFAKDEGGILLTASAFLKGLKAGGVASCLKHFPGHGGVCEDSHFELPRDKRPLNQLNLTPFFQLKSPAIMTAHIEFTNVESGPATFSKKFLQEILREEGGFEGVIVSDDIDMKALSSFSLEERFSRALLAGCDLILSCEKEETPLQIAEHFKSEKALLPLEASLKRASLRLKALHRNEVLSSFKEVSSILDAKAYQDLFESLNFI